MADRLKLIAKVALACVVRLPVLVPLYLLMVLGEKAEQLGDAYADATRWAAIERRR